MDGPELGDVTEKDTGDPVTRGYGVQVVILEAEIHKIP